MSQPSRPGKFRWLVPAILVVYLVMGVLYAVYTPAWQAPDEPAHYNYVAYLAEQHRFPVLKPGDYPAAYLEEIKTAHFPPALSIAPIRYEFHQPPLYYLLAVPIYEVSGGALLPLRLFSVVIGAVLLLVIYWTVGELVPQRPYLATGTMAFVAFLPMHLTFVAAVNNDTLAELLLTVLLLFTVRYVRFGAGMGSHPREAEDRAGIESYGTGAEERRLLVLLGITTGLGLITKSSVYVALPLVVMAILIRHLWLERKPPLSLASAVISYLLPATVLALPWWLRNIALYGSLDFLGLGRHDQVVAGQLRTAEFVAQHGTGRLVGDFFVTSFRSFWGQFGWMGVLLDSRLYQELAILSALALVGFGLWAARVWRRRFDLPRWQWAAGGLLALSGLFTVASYLWYNTQFVQHQGRYLFPALVPIGLAVALGWREVLRRERAVLLAGLLLAGAAILRLVAWLPTWALLMMVASAAAFIVRRILPSRWDPLAYALPYLVLIPLDMASLFLFIVPQLAV
jgi:4-amino-4-deoxy-L-arabinose transferase-like glycosyltransferase